MALAIIPKFLLPGAVAALAAGLGLSGGTPQTGEPAYGPMAERLDFQALAESAGATFARADLDNNRVLDAEEFGVLALVTAELARLNGFVAVDLDGRVLRIAAPSSRARELSPAERATIAAAAESEFAAAAGADARLDRNEFVSAQLELMLASDSNRDGALTKNELTVFAALSAKLASASV